MSERTELGQIRQEYPDAGLDEGDVDPDPVTQLRRWLDDAIAAEVPEPNAMTVATVDAEGRPSARTVLLKGLDQRGVVFFTNYASRKSRALEANPACALVLLWKPLQRQVCITGTATRLGREESATYFATRPRGARLGAWASEQSAVIASRGVLERRLAELEATWGEHDEIPLPPFWGGFVVAPDAVELWQGRPDRLHDRLRYSRTATGAWGLERLSP
ncbi:MAG: pyridoxamine 5'-phosphate oxidase [Actinomycetota bacterium]|nr:pyridoxamine 5'-phosphate oxidase [Actinomycetota bacterium]